MNTIVVVSTGGTIASIRNEKTGLLSAGALRGEELIGLCNVDYGMNIETDSIFQVPSNQMTFEKLIKLRQRILEIFKRKDVAGVVVTHGTDTLEESAYFLDLTIDDERPVVVTGSQLGPLEAGTDAMTNIGNAILVSASKKSRGLGTLVTFNNKIFTARHVTKSHASNIDGFSSRRYGYIGIIDFDKVCFYSRPLRSKTYKVTTVMPKVEIAKCAAGSELDYIKYLVDSGLKGLIVEGYGRGHVNPASLENIQYALDKGISVVIATSCGDGEVGKKYDFEGGAWDLEHRGAILGKDYDSKKARIKLIVMLSAGTEHIRNEFLV